MDVDITIIGAGAIGLAIAKTMACKGYSIALLEKEKQFGLGISSRNSEVIHAGVYYKTNSLKAKLCLEGKNLLYEFLKNHSIAHKKTGKLFLALTSEENTRLELTQIQAKENGINDLIYLDRYRLNQLEPEIESFAALLSPSSGIFDTYNYMRTLLSIAEQHGIMYAPNSPLIDAEPFSDGWKIQIGGNDPMELKTASVINSAGLNAISISRKIFPDREIPTLYPVKGAYVRYTGIRPVRHIIYPAIVPGKIEERVDATPDISNSLRFGPSVDVADHLEDFKIPDNIVERFIPSILRYLPNIDIRKLSPDIAGIRPKTFGSGESAKDFFFEWSPQQNWLDLWGMESPALTSSLAIGEHVSRLFQKNGVLN